MSFKIADIDFVFLSYDEPNAEKNFVMKSYEFPYNAQAVMGFAT